MPMSVEGALALRWLDEHAAGSAGVRRTLVQTLFGGTEQTLLRTRPVICLLNIYSH